MSIFSKLFKLFLTVVLMPLIPMALLLVYYQGHLKSNILETHYNLAGIVASSMNQHIEDLRWRLSFTQNLTKLLGEKRNPRPALQDALAANPDFVFLAVLNPQGKELYRAGEPQAMESLTAVDLSGDSSLAKMAREKRLSISNFDVQLGHPVSEFIYPLENGDFLYGIMSFSSVLARVQEQRIGRSGQIWLVDESGHLYDGDSSFSPQISAAAFQQLFAAEKRLIKGLKGREETYVGAFAPSPVMGTYVAVLQLKDEAFRSIHYSNIIILIFMLAIATLAYFGALTFAESLGEPIAALSDSAAAVSRGELDRKIDEDVGWGEFKHLIASFNKMTDDLRDYQTLQLKSQMSEMKEHLFRSVAHDLRAPLLGLQGYLYILQSGKATEPEKTQYLALMNEAAKNLSSLLEDVLEVSRIQAGILTPQKQAVDVAHLIQQTVNTLSPAALAKGLTLTAQVQAKTVWADPKLLLRVLMNLVSNAIKFTSKGGVTLRVTQNAAQTLISVQDSGIGMSDKEAALVFDKYYQAGETEGGYGLGLFISRQIAQAHDAQLTLRSSPGRGSTFTIALPKEDK